MNETPIEIHPYDFAELIHNRPVTFANTFKVRGDEKDNIFELDGKLYHRTATAPRTSGEHFIF